MRAWWVYLDDRRQGTRPMYLRDMRRHVATLARQKRGRVRVERVEVEGCAGPEVADSRPAESPSFHAANQEL